LPSLSPIRKNAVRRGDHSPGGSQLVMFTRGAPLAAGAVVATDVVQ